MTDQPVPAAPEEDEEPTADPVRPFAEFLHLQRAGALADELTDAFNALVRAVKHTGKPGQITLTLKVKRIAQLERMVMVTDSLARRLPEEERSGSAYFTDTHGNLSRNDPNQAELPFGQVPLRREGR